MLFSFNTEENYERVHFKYSLNVKRNVNVCYDICSYVNCEVTILISTYCLIIDF